MKKKKNIIVPIIVISLTGLAGLFIYNKIFKKMSYNQSLSYLIEVVQVSNPITAGGWDKDYVIAWANSHKNGKDKFYLKRTDSFYSTTTGKKL